MISCGGCDNRWSGLSRAHCATCHLTFTRVSLFDSHRKNGGCLTVIQLAKRGVTETSPGVWGGAGPESGSDFRWGSGNDPSGSEGELK